MRQIREGFDLSEGALRVRLDDAAAEIAGDEGGEQSLKGAKGEAFAKKMAAAAAHNRKVAKGSKAGAKPPSPKLIYLWRTRLSIARLRPAR